MEELHALRRSRYTITIMCCITIFSWIAYKGIGGLNAYRTIVMGIGLLSAFICFPYYYLKNNDFDKKANILLTGIIIMTAYATVKSALSTEIVHAGNKWTTLFGNEHCIYLMLAPLFMYLGVNILNIKFIVKNVWLYMLLSIWSIFVDGLALLPIAWCAGIFYPYVNKKYIFLLWIAIGESIYSAFFRIGTVRTQIIVLLVMFLSFFLPIILSRKYIKWICYALVIIPIIYSIIMLLDPNFSFFDVILGELSKQTTDDDLTEDSRSFLFYEMAEDLTKNKGWLLGKGASSTYFSFFFFQTLNGDYYHRIVSEVTILQLLMRGGIIYASLYYSLILCAIKNACNNANNRFVLSISIMAAGWVMVSCFSSEMGTTFIHLVIYSLLGSALSKNVVKKSDAEISEILRT